MKPIALTLIALAGLVGLTPVFADTAVQPEKPTRQGRKMTAGATPIVGLPAPAFTPTGWIQGEPVTAYEKGKVYLIECWATWCGPCCAQIPHLNELHKKYEKQGLVIIGTDVLDKERPFVEAFVKKKGSGMSYRVAYDDKDTGVIGKKWIVAQMKGIPHSFAIRDGIVLWQGHPKELSEAKIESMLAGTFDWKKAQKEQAAVMMEFQKASMTMKEINKLIDGKQYDEALKKMNAIGTDFPAGPTRDLEIAFFKVGLATDKTAEAVKRLEGYSLAQKDELELQYRIVNALLNAPLNENKRATGLALVIAKRLNTHPAAKGHTFETAFKMELERAVAIDSGKADPYPPKAH
jgi:thiol-disulfide isomerase/thioredoxin